MNDGFTEIAEALQPAIQLGLLVGQVEVEQHENSRLGINSEQGNQSHPHGDAHVVADCVQKPDRAHR